VNDSSAAGRPGLSVHGINGIVGRGVEISGLSVHGINGIV
jgi:hypothetical protein